MPNRINIVVTRDKNYKADGCVVVNSVDEALKVAENSDEIMIIGGEQIFREFLPIATKMYLTFIDKEFEGDVYFPEYNENEWKEVFREEHEEDGLRYVFVDLVKLDI